MASIIRKFINISLIYFMAQIMTVIIIFIMMYFFDLVVWCQLYRAP